MRVLQIIDGLGTGGAERSLAELVPHLEARGVECHVAYQFDRPGGVEEQVRRQATAVHRLDETNVVKRLFQLRRLLRELRPDVLHTNLFHSSVLARLASVGTGVAVTTSLVSTPYSDERRSDPSIRPRALELVRLVDSWTGRWRNDGFHAVNRTVAEAAMASLKLKPSSITVIERGRDVSRLGEPSPERRAAVRAQEGIDADAAVVLNVGRHVFQKGQRFLIEALPALVERHPEVLVLIAGREATETEELKELIERLGVGDHVRLLGQRQDLPDLLAAADVFALPSLVEGAAGAALEAHALALPVVGSDIPPLREALRDGVDSILVPLSDPEALATAILGLLDEPERRRRMGEAGRAWFLEHHTIDRAADRTVEMYEALASRR